MLQMAGKWVRRIGAGLAAYTLGVILLVASSSAVFHFVLANPAKVKGILSSSGVYDSIVETTAESLSEKPEKPSEKSGELPLSDPGVKKALNDAFPPKVLQANSEELIDGLYGWLDGKTKSPVFLLDFTKSKNTLAKEVGSYVEKRSAKLPPCGFSDIQTTVDPFEMKCLPPGITPAQIGAKATGDLRSDKNFLPNPKITPNNLFGEGSRKDSPFASNDAPSQFQLMKNLIWMLLPVAVLLGAAVILLSATKPAGIRKVAKSLLVVGVFVAITPFLLNFFSSRLANSSLLGNSLSSDIILPIIREFISAVSLVYYVFGISCILAAAAGFVITHRMSDGQKSSRP